MPTTRSRARGSVASPNTKTSKATSKRKADNTTTTSTLSPNKPKKQAKIDSQTGKLDDKINGVASDETIIINRAPVLELWAASVAQALHSDLSWQTCLSIGGAVSTIGAISKGRSIGTIDKPSKSDQNSKKEKRDEEQADLDEVHVMSFHLKLNGEGEALVGDKPKRPNEDGLRKKFGSDGEYDKARDAMSTALKSWEGKEEELNRRAFHMYEDFRPNVAPGQKGWGKKGSLSLKTIQDTVQAG